MVLKWAKPEYWTDNSCCAISKQGTVQQMHLGTQCCTMYRFVTQHFIRTTPQVLGVVSAVQQTTLDDCEWGHWVHFWWPW